MNRTKFLYHHKICDPIHGFIRFDDEEKKVIDSRPFQRLRYIHQMGVAYLIYPGASHKRFEHSLGVMELASQIYDSLTQSQLSIVPQTQEEHLYWKRVLRIAALCHDLGHLPFSHTAEKELLPKGGHELMTLKFIQSEQMRSIWSSIPQQGHNLEEDLIKLVLCEKELKELCPHLKLSSWEKILSQTITDDNFGADRVDYLIRDAYYTGVGYGHFDYKQLMDTIRILEKEGTFVLGVVKSGLQSIESLWIARYLMYARVYHHPKSRVYSKHLARFMMNYFCKNGFPSTLEKYITWTDYEMLSKIAQAADDPTDCGHLDALCLMNREKSYQEVPLGGCDLDLLQNEIASIKEQFKEDLFVDIVNVSNKESVRHFSILTSEGELASSIEESIFLRNIPIISCPVTLFIAPLRKQEVLSALKTFKKCASNLSG